MTLNLKNFLNPKIKISKMGEFQELQHIEGLKISSISADLYGDGRDRSEERRVGKECRSRWSPYH